MKQYKIGEKCEVKMPDGFLPGVVARVLKNYGFHRETKYEIHGDGKEFVTIASARVMRRRSVRRSVQ